MNKFQHITKTATQKDRAFVAFNSLKTLWINTGTLCNLECKNCYIKSSPRNDRFVYITLEDIQPYLSEINTNHSSAAEIAFTGGEPFMNPYMLDMLESVLSKGLSALVLTNAMQPMQRPKIQNKLINLKNTYGSKLTFRISLDHYTEQLHEQERGKRTWDITLKGLHWLNINDFKFTIAARLFSNETETEIRKKFADLFQVNHWKLNAQDSQDLVIFPELDTTIEIPEITTDCWNILNISPNDMMCSNSRMLVKEKNSKIPHLVSCTLLPHAPDFHCGSKLPQEKDKVYLNHPYCAQFCVLGGASCKT